MVEDLITFPIRIGLRATRVALRTGVQASERAASIASFVVKTATGAGAPGPGPREPSPQRAERPETSRPDRRNGASSAFSSSSSSSSASPAPPPARPADTPTVDLDAEPTPLTETGEHVSEEPEIVEEFAEPGAEEGAGAEVHIAEPWQGYTELTARQIMARLPSASDAELAAVQLYESAHKARETVLAAVERELRSKTGRAHEVNQTRKDEEPNGG